MPAGLRAKAERNESYYPVATPLSGVALPANRHEVIKMENVVIVDAVRTPMGRSKGGAFRRCAPKISPLT